MGRVDELVAVVTGGARGLGRSIAHSLGEEGARVAVVDVDLHSYLAFAAESAQMTDDSTDGELRQRGFDSRGYEADLTNRGDVLKVFEAIVSDFGAVDVLICNAGGGTGGLHENKAGSLGTDDLDIALRRNLFTVVNCCVAAAPVMRERRRGSIVTMSSINGLGPTIDGAYSHYGVSKAAVVMYTKYLARDLGPDGIRVNAVAPGVVPTARVTDVWAKAGTKVSTDDIALRRYPKISEIASTVVFLASDSSSYITGQVLTVDGGWTI